MIVPEGEIECPECGGAGYLEGDEHTRDCSIYGCSHRCPEYNTTPCLRCKGYGTLEMLEVLAQ